MTVAVLPQADGWEVGQGVVMVDAWQCDTGLKGSVAKCLKTTLSVHAAIGQCHPGRVGPCIKGGTEPLVSSAPHPHLGRTGLHWLWAPDIQLV